MLRHLLISLGLFVSFVAGSAVAQPGPDSIGVNVTSADFSFSDLYQFQTAGPSQPALSSGVLKTGGVTSSATIARQVTRTVAYTVTQTVYRVVNGRLVSEQVEVTRYRTVSETVLEHKEIELPAANGTWYAVNGPGNAVWMINSVTASGVVIGFGYRQGSQVHGMLTVVSLPGAAVPTGTYTVGTPAAME